MRAIKIFLVTLCTMLLWCCRSNPETTSIQLPSDGEFFDKIADYGIFTLNRSGLVPHPALIPYEVTSPLFTDYALKDRFLYLPEGQYITEQADGRYSYSEGAMLIKNFRYDDTQLPEARIIETRLLIHQNDTWRAMSYVWNEDQDEALISEVGDIIPLEIEHESRGKLAFDYVVPNKNQCKSCHNYDNDVDPLGFKYANLNRLIDNNGTPINQIDYLISGGALQEKKSAEHSFMVDYRDESKELSDRAMSYLDVNCGHCHRKNGPGNTSGLFLQHDESRTNHLGICKGPVAAGKGSGGRLFDIHPGKADSSIITYRMASIDPGVMMPELGRSLVHVEGVELISAWINSLDADCP